MVKLRLLPISPTINTTTTSISVHVTFRAKVEIFPIYTPRSGVAGSKRIHILSFVKYLQMIVSRVSLPVYVVIKTE